MSSPFTLLATFVGLLVVGAIIVKWEKRPPYDMGPMFLGDYVLLFWPVPATLFALIFLAIPPIDQIAIAGLSWLLDVVCVSDPVIWCRFPRPVPWFVTVHAFLYFVFLAISIYLFWQIWFGNLRKPLLYVPGSYPPAYRFFAIGLWLWVALGGQLASQRALAIPYFSFVWAAGIFVLATGLLKPALISLRFRRPAKDQL